MEREKLLTKRRWNIIHVIRQYIPVPIWHERRMFPDMDEETKYNYELSVYLRRLYDTDRLPATGEIKASPYSVIYDIRVGGLLLKTRVQLGLSRAQVAKQLGVSPNSVTNWEEGRAMPSDENLLKLLELYNLQLEDVQERNKPIYPFTSISEKESTDSIFLGYLEAIIDGLSTYSKEEVNEP